MIENLSDILKYTLKKTNEQVTLADECRIVKLSVPPESSFRHQNKIYS